MAAGEFVELTTWASLSDSDSVTSPARYEDYCSTSSDSGLSDSLQDSEVPQTVTAPL